MLKTITSSIREEEDRFTFSLKGTDKVQAIVAGCFFSTATLLAIAGLKRYDPLPATGNFVYEESAHSDQIILGAESKPSGAGCCSHNNYNCGGMETITIPQPIFQTALQNK